MPERARVFADCGKVILQIYAASGEGEEQSVEPITIARKHTLAIIREIAEACETDADCKIATAALGALSDLHPEVLYIYQVKGQSTGKLVQEKLIRDLAEVCATFLSLELGVERRSRERILEVRLFCTHMADELSHL